jgi:hypothetical protein
MDAFSDMKKAAESEASMARSAKVDAKFEYDAAAAEVSDNVLMLEGCPYDECNGPYVPDRTINKRPRWHMRYPDSEGGGAWIYRAKSGQWFFTRVEEDIRSGTGSFCTRDAHHDPQDAVVWLHAPSEQEYEGFRVYIELQETLVRRNIMAERRLEDEEKARSFKEANQRAAAEAAQLTR